VAFPGPEVVGRRPAAISYHVEADSATAYGLPAAHAVSTDWGQTWESLSHQEAERLAGVTRLPSRDRLRPIALPSRKVSRLTLPQPIAHEAGTMAL
jgi:hypothetical protein